jgi:asparagine synthase (glutamine-hydrolysing)
LSETIKVGAEPGTHPYQHTSELGAVVLAGQCLAMPDSLKTAAQSALQRGDVDALRQLPGGYSIFLQQGENLVVDTDPSSQFPVYWQPGSESPRVSMTAANLGSKPNPAFLAAWILGSQEMVHCQSAFQGVHCLEGGKTARFVSGRLVSSHETFISSDPCYTLEEAALAFRGALIEAMDSRLQLQKTITSDCSGGFDSSVLARLLAGRGDGGVDAFMQYTPGLASGDLQYARLVAQSHPDLRLHEIVADESMLFFQQLGAFVPSDEPSAWMTASAGIHARLTNAKAYGSQIHLSGSGGDALLDAGSGYIVDLARQGNLEQLQAICRAYGRARSIDPDWYLAHALRGVGRTRADDLHALASYLADPDALQDTIHHQLTWSWIHQDSAGFLTDAIRQDLSAQANEAAIQTADTEVSVADFESMRGIQGCGERHRQVRSLAQRLGIEMHTPYMDRKVVEACLRLPSAVRAEPGKFKQLMHAAFADILPDPLKRRQSKGVYSNELYKGLRLARDTLIDLFARDCHLADLGIVEPRRVLQEIGRLDMGVEGATQAVMRLVASETWLRELAGEPVTALKPRKRVNPPVSTRQPEVLEKKWRIPDYIHPLLHDGGVVYLNSRSGEWGAKSRAAGASLLAASGLLHQMKQELDWPELHAPWPSLVNQEILDALANSQLLSAGEGPEASFLKASPWAAGEQLEAGGVIMTRNPAESRQLPAHLEKAARHGLDEAFRLVEQPSFLGHLTSRIQTVRQGLRPASVAQAEEIAKSVYQLEDRYGGRLACLERTIATVLAGAQLGVHIDMQLGAAVDPIAFHAWSETEGRTISLEGEESIAGRYYKILQI